MQYKQQWVGIYTYCDTVSWHTWHSESSSWDVWITAWDLTLAHAHHLVKLFDTRTVKMYRDSKAKLICSGIVPLIHSVLFCNIRSYWATPVTFQGRVCRDPSCSLTKSCPWLHNHTVASRTTIHPEVRAMPQPACLEHGYRPNTGSYAQLGEAIQHATSVQCH